MNWYLKKYFRNFKKKIKTIFVESIRKVIFYIIYKIILKKVILFQIEGCIGTQLFQYATGRSLEEKNEFVF